MNAQSKPEGLPAWYVEAVEAAALSGPEMDAEAISSIVARWQKERGVAQDRRIVGAAIKAARAKAANEEAAEAAAEDANFWTLLEGLNRTHFILHYGPEVVIGHYVNDVVERPFGTYTRKRLVLQSHRQFVDAHRHINRLKRGRVTETLGEAWLEWTDRRTFYGLKLSTETDAEGRLKPPVGVAGEPFLNLWQGWPVKPRKGDATPFLHYVREALASGDDVSEAYILDWLAWVVQNPAKRAGVMLAFIGDQGVGKGLLGNFMVYLFGDQGRAVGTSDHIAGRFNDHLMGCCMLFADEALFAGSKAAADRLKGYVTEPNLTVEAKGKPIITVPNNLSIIAATNHAHGFHVEASDRRHAIFYVEKDEARTKDGYWVPLVKWLYSDEGSGAVLDMLLTRDVSTFDTERDRPVTEALMDQMTASFSDEDQWWDTAAVPFLLRLSEAGTSKRAGDHLGEMETGDTGWAEYMPAHGGMPAGVKIDKEKAYRAFTIWRSRQAGTRFAPPAAAIFWRSARQKWLGVKPNTYLRGHIRADAETMMACRKRFHRSE